MLEFVKKTGLETGSLRFLFASISIFVAFVVAALVLFSNNFIIRRRKREIGIYLLLGMNQHSIQPHVILSRRWRSAFSPTVLGIAIGIAFSGVFSLIFSGMLNGVVTIFSVQYICTLVY
jgi:putative ABC transport system permease protein